MSAIARTAARRAIKTPAASARGYASVSSQQVGGVRVAGFDNGQPTTSISVIVKAGSRYENAPGVAHALSRFAFKSTNAGSALKTVRETELYGGVLSSTHDREHIVLNAEFLRGDEDYFLNLLSSVLSSTKFSRHEFAELVLPTLQADAIQASSSPVALALDAAHELAFRRGLGNSLYASPNSPITAEQVRDFASKAFAKSNIAVVGTGISTEALGKAVGAAFGSGSSSASSSGGSMGSSSSGSTYFGGEKRIAIDSHAFPAQQPTLVIAYGSGSAPTPELKALPYVLGGTSPLKWAPGVSPLSLAADKVPGGSARSFLLPYTDAALFGVIVQAPTSEAVRALATEVASVLKSSGDKLGEEEFKRAVAQAKFAAASQLENKQGLIEAVAPQIFNGEAQSAEEVVKAFGGVSAESIAKSTAELLKGKPTVVAVGNLHVLPYSDELGL